MLGAGGRSPACCGMPGPALLFSHLLWAPAPGGRRSQWNLGLRKRGGGAVRVTLVLNLARVQEGGAGPGPCPPLLMKGPG